MVQMPVHPSVDWKTMSLPDYKFMIMDFTEEIRFDEDLAKCILRWTLKQGGVLNIKKASGDMIARIDQTIIKGTRHNAFINKLIKPLMEKLEARVYDITDVDKHGIHAVTSTGHWHTGLPGVTKIKIKYHRSYIYFNLNHKMGRDGGRNYHDSGSFDELDKPKNDG